MPKPFTQIHAKYKPHQLQNERKQELKRHPHKVPFCIPKKDKPVETNAFGMIFFMVLNAELLKFGDMIKTPYSFQHEKNSPRIFSNNKKVFKNTWTVVEDYQDGPIGASLFVKK